MKLFAALCLLAGLGLSPAGADESIPPETLDPGADGVFDLLFVGNSLTYSNRMPRMLRRLLEQSGVPAGRIEVEALPNYGLEDHWERPRTRRLLADGPWDIVFIQQGPSAGEGRPSLLEYTRRFADEARRSGSRIGVLMVWPSRARAGDYPAVIANHRRAAGENDALIFPAGEAWQRYRAGGAGPRLYGRDGFHPSRLGSYLTALTLWQCFDEGSFGEIDHAAAMGSRRAPDAEVIRRLQAAVDAAYGARDAKRCLP